MVKTIKALKRLGKGEIIWKGSVRGTRTAAWRHIKVVSGIATVRVSRTS